jgi:hypothetical protein
VSDHDFVVSDEDFFDQQSNDTCEWRSNSPHLWHLKFPQFS